MPIKQSKSSKKANKKVLVVEDEPLLATMYMTVLKRVRADIYGARTKQEGEKIITRIQPDLILLDLMIPSTTIQDTQSDYHDPVGFQLLREIRSDPKSKGTRVIILSNLDADEHRKKAIQLGAIDYLVKASYPPQAVADKVQGALDKG